MGQLKIIKIGKYKCTVTAQNEPSEEAILSCRRVVTRIMDELFEAGKLEELLKLNKSNKNE